MDKNNITLTEDEFKMFISCGFISGYKFALENNMSRATKTTIRLASVPCGDDLWKRSKIAEQKSISVIGAFKTYIGCNTESLLNVIEKLKEQKMG